MSRCTLSLLGLLLSAAPLSAADGEVLSNAKISATQGGFSGGVMGNFGDAVARLEDLDGDGVAELAVGELYDNDGGPSRGAVWVLFMETDGSVKAQQKISSTQGGLAPGSLADGDEFGSAVSSLGDLDGDGVGDLAVGAPEDDDGGTARGAVYVLLLNANGTVKSQVKISSNGPFLSSELTNFARFGRSLAWLGDFDGDGMRPALAVGIPFDDDGAVLEDRGAVMLLFLNPNGTVTAFQKISDTQGAFGGTLDDYDWFGSSLAYLGDLDGDGVGDLGVGAMRDDDGGTNRGSAWVLFLWAGGTVKAQQKISSTSGGFTGSLGDFEEFGASLSSVDDLDNDGLRELAVGVPRDADGGSNRGAVYILFLDAAGVVQSHQKISSTSGGFAGPLQNFDVFGGSIADLGDLDGDGRPDLAVGAVGDDDGGANFGAVWLLFLDGVASAAASPYGCGTNPAGSLALHNKLPVSGENFSVVMQNPLGTQSGGSATVLLLSRAVGPGGPCGFPLPGYGMSGPGANGALLVDLLPPNYLFALIGPNWPGPGSVAKLTMAVPPEPILNGFEFYGQGLLYDAGSPVQFGLTNGLAMRIGE